MSIPAISVIVPVYNASRYLVRCIDSILAQSFTDFECLLVNDGSTDDSLEICKKYENLDQRIRVYHQENGGVSSARNLGIDRASGEWIAFVDSDDAIKSDFLQVLLSNINDTQMVCSYATVVDTDYTHDCEKYQGKIESDVIENIFELYRLRTNAAPWGKLFKASIIKQNGIHFNERMHIGEDTVFILNYIKYVQSINIVNNASYQYYINNSSLVRRINSPASEYYSYCQIKEACDIALSSIPSCKAPVIEEINRMLSAYIRRVINSLYYNNVPYSERIKYIQSVDTDLFCKYFITDSAWGRFCIILLRYRMIPLYDFLRTIVSKYRINHTH